MEQNDNPNEIRARELLRDLVGDAEFKRYLVRGFIMVRGKSGVLYKICGGYERVVSYTKGQDGKYHPFETFCVVFKNGKLPHTDWVVMRKILIDTDEFGFRKIAVIHRVDPAAQLLPAQQQPAYNWGQQPVALVG
jgi:hypothetical protein